MTPHYADDWLTVYHGDSRAVMAEMEPESVHCVVTSPPYWGLRDYGTATWVGGDEACDHSPLTSSRANRPSSGLTGGKATVDAGTVRRGDCRCGAQRNDDQLGLEPTPEAYVANMVEVFREVRRVLRSDGTVWLNLGDSYAGSGKGGNPEGSQWSGFHGSTGREASAKASPPIVPFGLKPKDLVGIPWMVAFALRADGWYLRSDIIWAKPNPMPESVTDRPTKSHEYLFLLSKSPRYYFDADAVREAYSDKTDWTYAQPDKAARAGMTTNGTGASTLRTEGRRSCARYFGSDGSLCATHNRRFADDASPRCDRAGNVGRNIRSVWTVATAPYPGAHFATFPPKLIEPCIKAGCPTLGTVLDPFAGSGTTGLVAQRLSRRAVLIDLSMDYLGQLLERNRDIPLGLGA